MTNVDELRAKKESIRKKLQELKEAKDKGLLTPEEFMAKNYELLGGWFVEDYYREIDNEIEKHSKKKKTKAIAVVSFVLLILAIPLLKLGGLTSFVVFGGENLANLTINESFTQNTTKNYSFITADSLRLNGRIYGHGETWVYLLDGAGKKLVYYTDTRTSTPTGLVVGIPVNETNATVNQTTNVTVNQTNTTNTTVPVANGTNSSVNATVNQTNTTNATISQTNTTSTTINQTPTNTTNVTVNQTVSTNTTNTTVPVVNNTNQSSAFNPEVITGKDVYEVGENISIVIIPPDSTSTIYMHSPSDTYFLPEQYFVPIETGVHTVSAIITKGDDTARVTKDLDVIAGVLTNVLTNVCVETCSIAETELVLEIIVDNTRLELESISYGLVSNETNETQAPVQSTPQQTARQKQIAMLRSCLAKNPNARPKHCFDNQEIKEKFPDVQIDLLNELGQVAARFNKNGDLLLRGELVERTNSEPQPLDLVVRGSQGPQAWIDVLTGDLHLKGALYENQETLMWENKRDYVVNNRAGMYLGIFGSETGNLFIRGTIVEGGLS